MKTSFSPKNNPRVIIIQKLYGKFYNVDEDLDFPKHRFKKFIIYIIYFVKNFNLIPKRCRLILLKNPLLHDLLLKKTYTKKLFHQQIFQN